MPASPSAQLQRERLEVVLLRLGLATPDQLAQASADSGADRKTVAQRLLEMGVMTEEKVLKAISVQLRIPCLMTFEGMIEPEATRLIPEALARKLLVVPLMRNEDVLTVGMADPLDLEAIDVVSRATGCRVRSVMTSLTNLLESIQRSYEEAPSATPAPMAPKAIPERRQDVAAAAATPPTLEFEPLLPGGVPPRHLAPPVPSGSEATAKPPGHDANFAVELVERLLREALERRASDLHLEPAARALRARYRVDGMLQEAETLGKELESAVVARLKILSKLDITETRLPQDGHIRYAHGTREVDIRVSTLPTIHGEKVVLRILDSANNLLRLEDLGLSEANFKGFSQAVQRPNGMILVTGPTGSGKTTTLYSAVQLLNDAQRNIVTLEDPVEYHIDGINQVETFSKIGLSFASGLRSILRQDPNVILVGEIRDRETAEISIQAAITGHIVMSTLHTNDAVSTIHRLIDMRVEPYLLAAALRGVMAQRLVRRLCESCRRERPLSAAEAASLGLAAPQGAFFEPVGCGRCRGTGYAGRLAVHEWVSLTRTMRDAVLGRASIDELRAMAKSEGMIGLREDGVAKAARGLTSLAEIVRISNEDVQA